MFGVPPLLGKDALEGSVKDGGPLRVMHLATHGFFLTGATGTAGVDPMLRSGVALAGFNAWLRDEQRPIAAEDGVLTADDLLEVPLADADLVVLSACETGLGYASDGEGVFGLRRALSVVGARAAVLSLWSVPDATTKDLMVSFYSKVISGYAASTALCLAQREVRQHHSARAWAAFTFSGAG